MRSQKLERLDTGEYTPKEYRDCLQKFAIVGEQLGGDRASFWGFDQLDNISSILDVGCGGGQFATKLARRYPQAQVTGIDISPEAIEFAQKQQLPNLSFEVSKKLRPADVITATLVCHHMSDQQLVQFLQEAKQMARRAVIINDLHRHPLAWLGFALYAPLLLRNRLMFEDGLLSVRRGFTRRDWDRLLSGNWQITWKWPFRWILLSLAEESPDSPLPTS